MNWICTCFLPTFVGSFLTVGAPFSTTILVFIAILNIRVKGICKSRKYDDQPKAYRKDLRSQSQSELDITGPSKRSILK